MSEEAGVCSHGKERRGGGSLRRSRELSLSLSFFFFSSKILRVHSLRDLRGEKERSLGKADTPPANQLPTKVKD